MKDNDWTPCDTQCSCGERKTEYRTVEDSEGHTDEQYHCLACGREWWIDGPDY